jgi:hypothetical protein
MTTKIMVRAKGYRPRLLTLEYVRHEGTITPRRVGGGDPNVDCDLYRVVETGHEVEIQTPSNDCRMFPTSMVVRRAEAPLYGLTPRIP